MPSYLSSDLINAVKVKAMIPGAQNTFDDDDILLLLNEEMSTAIVPQILDVREEYFVKFAEQEITSQSVDTGYDIPDRAIAMKLRDITVVQGESTGKNEISLPVISQDEVPTRTSGYDSYYSQAAFLRSNKVHLVPAQGLTGTLRLYYFRRPSELVQTTKAARIDAIDTNANTITLGNVPSNFNPTAAYDFVQVNPPFDSLSDGQVPVSVNSTLFEFESIPEGLKVGDYLCLAGESVTCQIPLEYQPVLIQRTVVRVLEALNDAQGAMLAKERLQELQYHAQQMVADRVEGAAKKIVNVNSPFNVGTKFNKFFTS